MEHEADRALLEQLWADLGGPARALESVSLEGPSGGLPSVHEVSAFAAATVALATTSAAELLAARTSGSRRSVRVDRRHAAVAFRSERYLSAAGWTLPPMWDPVAGDYPASDGWIRLHTNYRHHRAAVLRVLGVPESRAAVAAAVRASHSEDLEAAIVAEGGCAARMRTAEEFRDHPQGRAILREPTFAWATHEISRCDLGREPRAPLEGLRVLDLTRVIAGPVCTRFLAAHGADVLRIDPPGFEEGPGLLAETTGGKRCASLDLRDADARGTFERVVSEAHVVVIGYRSDALARLGFDDAWFHRTNPSAVRVLLDAYGWTGPWARRRGFDSLVQMSSGIAATGQEVMKSARPFPLPAQALDHGTGYLAAAAACRALTRVVEDGVASDVRLSLARTGRVLTEMGAGGDPRAPELSSEDAEPYLEDAESAWGGIRRVRCPGAIDGAVPKWSRASGPLGRETASFQSAK